MSEHLPIPAPRHALTAPHADPGNVTAPPQQTRHIRRPRLEQVTCLDYTHGLLAAGGGRVCCMWDTTTHALKCRIVVPAPISALWMTRDRMSIALAWGRCVSVHDLATGALRLEYRHEAEVTSVHTDGTDPILASADVTGVVQLRRVETGALLHEPRHPPGRPIVFVHRGTILLVESQTHTSMVDIASGQSVREFRYDADAAVASEGPRMNNMLVSHSGSVLRWFDCACYEGAYQTVDLGARIVSIDIRNEEGLVLAAVADGRICFFGLSSGEPRGQWDSFTRPLLYAKFGADASVYAAGGEALVMHFVGGKHMCSFYDESPSIVAMASHSRNHALLVSDRDGGVTRFDLRDGHRDDRFGGHSGSVSVIVCDDERVASGAYDGTVRVFDWDGSLIAAIVIGEGPVQAIALDRHARTVWVGTWSGKVSCFDLCTRERLYTFACSSVSIRSLSLDPARQRLLVGDDDGSFQVINLASGGRACGPTRQLGCIYRAVFADDGDVLATAAEGVRRYADGATQPHWVYQGTDIRWFDVSGGRLYALSLTGELKIHDLATGDVLQRTQLEGAGPHRSVVVLGSDRVLTGSGDGLVRVFDSNLKPLAAAELLRRGFLWSTTSENGHPGWLATDRTDLLDVGQQGSEMFLPLDRSDSRRARHLAVYNSVSHAMQVVAGSPAKARATAASLPGLAPLASSAHRLSYAPATPEPR